LAIGNRQSAIGKQFSRDAPAEHLSRTRCFITPQPTSRSGYRSITQYTSFVRFTSRSSHPASAMNGGVVKQITTSGRLMKSAFRVAATSG
jgi:hypothetical protein